MNSFLQTLINLFEYTKTKQTKQNTAISCQNLVKAFYQNVTEKKVK